MNITTDKAAEVAVLSACLVSPSARKAAKRHVSREDFYQPEHMTVWDAMCQLDRDKVGVDEFTLRDRVGHNAAALACLLEVMGAMAMPDNVAHYANTVRSWAVRRRLYSAATRVQQAAENPEVDASGLASSVAARFAQVRDSGLAEDVQSITLDELLASPDDEPEWVIPDLLEKRDRFMLTGGEGLGKSYLLRQIAILSAGGMHPFTLAPIPPVKALIVDCENSLAQVKRKARGAVDFASQRGTGRAGQVNLLCCGRIDLLRDKDLAMIHREIDAIQPDVIVIGPIYAMSPKALMTDDDAVPVLAALDTMREGGAALLMEAHAGHAVGADGRNYRPRGSAALMGWPEFGYGMKPESDGYARLIPWRGDRDARDWPKDIRHDKDGIRWIVHDGRGYATTPETAQWSPTRGMA